MDYVDVGGNVWHISGTAYDATLTADSYPPPASWPGPAPQAARPPSIHDRGRQAFGSGVYDFVGWWCVAHFVLLPIAIGVVLLFSAIFGS